MIRLLKVASDLFVEELAQRLATVGLGDIRPGHGCVFGNIDPENGSRLTELAELANMTKQSVGEVTSDLEQRGYLSESRTPRTVAPKSSVSPPKAATHMGSGVN